MTAAVTLDVESPEEHAGFLRAFTGTSPCRPMKGMVFVEPECLHGEALQHWITAAVSYARNLPPNTPHPPGTAGDLPESTPAGLPPPT
jgi:hypothetical protein